MVMREQMFKYKASHCQAVCKSLWSLQQAGQLCDIFLIVGDDTDVIFAHRTVLAASSPFFLQLASLGRTQEEMVEESKSGLKVLVHDSSREAVHEVVRYMYMGCMGLSAENVEAVRHLCKRWEVDSALRLCERFKRLLKKEIQIKVALRTYSKPVREKRDIVRQQQEQKGWLRGRKRLSYVEEEEQEQQQIEKVSGNLVAMSAIEDDDATDVDEPPEGLEKDGFHDSPSNNQNQDQDSKPPGTFPGETAAINEEDSEVAVVVTEPSIASSSERCEVPPVLKRKVGRPKGSKTKVRWKSLVAAPQDGSLRKVTEKANKKLHKSTNPCRGPLVLSHPQVKPGSIARRAHLKGTRGVRCMRCREKLPSTAVLSEHKLTCAKCYWCKKTFETPKACSQHLSQNLCDKSMEEKFDCDKCGRNFAQLKSLESHVLSMHWTEEMGDQHMQKCEIDGCTYETVLSRNLQKHMRYTHSDNKPLMCDTCGAMSKNEYYLKIHKRNRHSKLLSCNLCGFLVKTRQVLKSHKMRQHGIGTPEFLCSMCTYITYTRTELEKHMFHRHKVPLPSGNEGYTCPHCKWKCIQRASMEQHILRHTAKERNYPCTICSKRFITTSDLRGHMMIHNPDRKRHKCPHCDYSTAYGRFKLRDHVNRIHEKKDYKPWACELCSYCTNVKGNLTSHLRKTHKVTIDSRQHIITQVESDRHDKIHMEPLPQTPNSRPRDTKMQGRRGVAGKGEKSEQCLSPDVTGKGDMAVQEGTGRQGHSDVDSCVHDGGHASVGGQGDICMRLGVSGQGDIGECVGVGGQSDVAAHACADGEGDIGRRLGVGGQGDAGERVGVGGQSDIAGHGCVGEQGGIGGPGDVGGSAEVGALANESRMLPVVQHTPIHASSLPAATPKYMPTPPPETSLGDISGHIPVHLSNHIPVPVTRGMSGAETCAVNTNTFVFPRMSLGTIPHQPPPPSVTSMIPPAHVNTTPGLMVPSAITYTEGQGRLRHSPQEPMRHHLQHHQPQPHSQPHAQPQRHPQPQSYLQGPHLQVQPLNMVTVPVSRALGPPPLHGGTCNSLYMDSIINSLASRNDQL